MKPKDIITKMHSTRQNFYEGLTTFKTLVKGGLVETTKPRDSTRNLLDKFIEDKDQKNALAHEISTMAERHAQELAMSQIAVNQEEAKSGSLFIGGWRPFVGWICGIALLYHFILQPCILFFAQSLELHYHLYLHLTWAV